MNQEQRKSQRISEFMPVAVFITGAGGESLAGPFAGRVVDLCRDGACLLMSQVEAAGWHVFRSPREDGSRLLRLEVKQPDQDLCLTVSARPVWLNTFERDEFQERVMGVTFLNSDNTPGVGGFHPCAC